MGDEIHEKLERVVRQVFGDLSLSLTPEMTAADIDGWDSLTHVNLMIAVERRFAIRFSLAEMASITAHGRNVGDFEQLIAHKLTEKK